MEDTTVKVLVIDGQGGRIGKLLVEQIKLSLPGVEIIAIGTNSIATAAMLKAGADHGATGENPVVFNCTDADIIIGPLGIVIANALLGEITPAMAQAIGQCKAHKILIPVNRCNHTIVGTRDLPLGEYLQLALGELRSFLGE